MDDFKYIFNLIKQGENQQLDFKQTITSASKIAKTIVAYANSEGGKILIGVDDQGDLIGVDIGQEKYMMIKAGKHYCDPPVFIHFKELRAKRMAFLEAEVMKSTSGQHVAKDEAGVWLPYVRVNDQTVVMPGYEALQNADKHNLNPIPILMQRNQGLVNYLERHESISLIDYIKMMNISYDVAKRSLRELTEADVLEETTHQNQAYYSLKKKLSDSL